MKNSKKRGFTIIEILVVISLIGIFMLAMAQIQVSEMKQSKAAQAHDSAAARSDAAVKALRADMWGGKIVQWGGESRHLMILIQGAEPFTMSGAQWEVLGDDHRLLRRTVDKATTEDFALPQPVSFESLSIPDIWIGSDPSPCAIRLHIGDEQILLPSKVVFRASPAEAKGPAQ